MKIVMIFISLIFSSTVYSFGLGDLTKELGGALNQVAKGLDKSEKTSTTDTNQKSTPKEEPIVSRDTKESPQHEGGSCFDFGLPDIKDCQVKAEQGDAGAQFILGDMYDYGKGVEVDYKEAVKWYGLAAAQGHPHALFKIGLMYDNGEGVPQNHKEAVKWFRLAAKQGSSQAQSRLQSMNSNRQGLSQDSKE